MAMRDYASDGRYHIVTNSHGAKSYKTVVYDFQSGKVVEFKVARSIDKATVNHWFFLAAYTKVSP